MSYLYMWWVKVYGCCVWWLRVCEKYESVEKKILKPLILGLFIGQGLGFKDMYLGSCCPSVGLGCLTPVQVSAKE